jgi:hypothetical protein
LLKAYKIYGINPRNRFNEGYEWEGNFSRSNIRVSQKGRDKLEKHLPKIYADTPNFRCKVVRIADGKIFATPTEYGSDDFVEPSENEKVMISNYEFEFSPEEVIIE